jgi:histidinol-phosphate aminotransferase
MTGRFLSPRPEILATLPDRHGALDYAELERAGLDPERVLDFSVNSNPYGPPPGVWNALRIVPLDRYPDREALALRRALSARLSLSIEQIVAGNGTAELIWLVAMAFVRSGDRVLVIGPTFGEYARAVALMGAQVTTWMASPEEDFAVSTAQVGQALANVRPRVVFVCTPNNPTGAVIPLEAVESWAGAHPHTLFVVDEAYIQFVDDLASVASLGMENLLVLRSMTKDYALAGLRLGYALGSREVIGTLARARPPWSVNGLAQAAGVAALKDEGYLRESLRKLRRAKNDMVAGLRVLGLAPLPSATHYFLIEVGDGTAFRRALMSRHILVRDCASFGLPGYVRIATRTPADNARLLEAIREVNG